MRRGHGIAALKHQQQFQDRARALGQELTEQKMQEFKQHYDSFQQKLHEFANKHRKRINSDPQFRYRFWQMCSELDVDPLSSSKGVWDQLGMGDFYYGLAVQISHICLATRSLNGGLLCLQDLRTHLAKRRRVPPDSITYDDIERSVKSLQVLGPGFELVRLQNKTLIRSVPEELSQDDTTLLSLAETSGFVNTTIINTKLQWQQQRIDKAIDSLLKQGISWVDGQADEPTYYILSLQSRVEFE
ncbi:hypothetical protein RCL1_004672 [Eukaryota sp. TZLM3-RCL]